jgi:hypothetical protein
MGNEVTLQCCQHCSLSGCSFMDFMTQTCWRICNGVRCVVLSNCNEWNTSDLLYSQHCVIAREIYLKWRFLLMRFRNHKMFIASSNTDLTPFKIFGCSPYLQLCIEPHWILWQTGCQFANINSFCVNIHVPSWYQAVFTITNNESRVCLRTDMYSRKTKT